MKKMANTIVFTFGRWNPPTAGHAKVVDKVLETARQVGGDHCVYLSQTHNNKTDPLEWKFKTRIFESAFPGVNLSKDMEIKNPFYALKSLSENYDRAILVVGSDQLKEFKQRMTPYAAEYGIDFKVISAGKRIDEDTGVSGISATKMRYYALNDMREEFFNGLPTTLSEGIKNLVFLNTKRGLKRP